MDYFLDPELAAVSAALPKMDPADLAAARDAGQMFAQPKYFCRTPLAVRDILIRGRHNSGEVPIRVYAAVEHSIPAPALLYLHGSTSAFGGSAMADLTAPLLVEWAGITVVTVDYRLTSDYPYPAALDDCYAVLEWAADEGNRVGIDPDRLGVLGEGVGGGLAGGVRNPV